MTDQFKTVDEAFDFIKPHAGKEGDILFILGQAPDDYESMLPGTETHIFLGYPNNTFDNWDGLLCVRFCDDGDEDSHPFQLLTDEQWEELRVKLETLAISVDEWREHHKMYNLCGCGASGELRWEIGYSEDEGDADEELFYQRGDAMCKECANKYGADGYENDHLRELVAEARKILAREKAKYGTS